MNLHFETNGSMYVKLSEPTCHKRMAIRYTDFKNSKVIQIGKDKSTAHLLESEATRQLLMDVRF